MASSKAGIYPLPYTMPKIEEVLHYSSLFENRRGINKKNNRLIVVLPKGKFSQYETRFIMNDAVALR